MAPAAAIEPEKILKELRELWVQLGERQDAPGGVLRACSMTLVVAAEPDGTGADAERAHRTIGVLMHDHPSRAIVISPREGGEGGEGVTEMGARVFSECWMPFGGQQQICAEGIEITADSEQTDEVARLLVPLLAPDLPVVLWCRGARAFLDRSLDALFPLADKIVFDTLGVRHAPSAIEFLRRMQRDRRHVADLAWTRLTAWREAVCHLLDRDAGGVTAARVTHAGEKPTTSALYFARWIERALPGADVRLEPAGAAQAAAPAMDATGVCGVSFSAHEGAEGALSLSPAGLPPTTEETLMREEMSILGRDPVFERVLL